MQGAAWPLTGRETELDAARTALERTGGAELVGAPGSGRTRLAHAIGRGESGRGRRVELLTGTTWGADVPLGALAVRHPGLADAPPDVARGVQRTRAALDVGSGPVTVVVDDAHLVDALTAQVLHRLVGAGEVRLLLTAPTGADLPEAFAVLRGAGHVVRVELAPLTHDEVHHLLEAVLGAAVEGATAFELAELSGGAPRLLRALVTDGCSSGALRRTGEVWRWHDDVRPTPGLRAVVLARFRGLPVGQRELLDRLALAGAVGLEVVERLPGGAEVGELDRAGLVSSREEGRRLVVDLAHRVDGPSLRAEQSPLVRRRGFRELAAALEAALDAAGRRRTEDTARLLTWRLEGGVAVDTDELVAAAVTAPPSWAEPLLVRALEQGAGFEAAQRLAGILVAQGRYDEAGERYRAAFEGPADDEARAELAVRWATVQAWAVADGAAPRRIHTELLARLDGRPHPTGVAVLDAVALLEEGRYADADAVLTPLLDPDEPGSVPAFVTAAVARPLAGRLEAGADAARRALALMEGDGGPDLISHRLLARSGGLWMSRVWAGEFDEAAALARDWYAEARAAGLGVAGPLRAVYALMIGVDAARRGRLDTAVRWLRDCASQDEIERVPCAPQLCGEMLAVLAQSGRVDEIRVWLDHLDAGRVVDVVHFRPWVALGRAWAEAAAGRPGAAAERAVAVADEAAGLGQHCYEVDALHVAARLGARARVADRLAAVATRTDSPLAAWHARYAAAVSGEELDEAAAGYARFGTMLLAAEAALEAAGAHRAAGRPGPAAASAARSRTWAEDCESPATPILTASRQEDDLTAREREIAELASTGLSSRQIAATLVLSTRTVDNVLGAVYAKLGVRGRTELTALLRGEPTTGR
ncbi:helix-turn-helix transcriptional regulator [Actinomycetospora termitidis]|uniref:LuxR C-terminal-related transcriptional regulator n=1 Tax=Actinomycetospora termitidis TaxID=3053470 RepID=A0ABT7MAJ3_9PSEU|nr:LuxR family transcriptional regulator [Actinomycetospora sp. Odt1-22]MDL5157684.1 LuxR C-terminal-related transcriptional regulator [Actinomycetospora sp. Odt1-22]